MGYLHYFFFIAGLGKSVIVIILSKVSSSSDKAKASIFGFFDPGILLENTIMQIFSLVRGFEKKKKKRLNKKQYPDLDFVYTYHQSRRNMF